MSTDAPWMREPVSTPGGPVRLRPERAGDAAFLRMLFHAAASPLPGLPSAMTERLLDMQFGSQAHTYRTAFPGAWSAILECAGEPVGRLLLAPGDPALVVDYALLPGARSGGTGGAVLAAVLHRTGVTTRATVLAGNAACLAMCARLGFREVAADPPFVQLEWRPPGGNPAC